MTESDSERKNHALKGRINYLAWVTRMEVLLGLEEVIGRDDKNKIIITGASEALKKKNEIRAKKYIVSNCDDNVMHMINPKETFDKILSKLNSMYGYGNMDPSIILRELRELKFHPSIDPSVTLNEINIKLAQLSSAGGKITELQMVEYMHDGLSGDPLRDNFWFNCRGAMNMAKLSSYNVESAGKFITQYWYSYKPNKRYESANRTYESRFCQHCKDNNREKNYENPQ